MTHTTLLFLIKRDQQNAITEICLAMKKRGFGTGKWNGAGGKLLPSESIQDALLRETEEEICVVPKEYYKVAELVFFFTHTPEWNQDVEVYFCPVWDGVPSETEEMNPKWFSADTLPFDSMWPDDIFWLPKAIQGAFIKAQ